MRWPRHDQGTRRWVSKWSLPPGRGELLHRFGGPAMECPNGHKQWHWHGSLKYAEVTGDHTTETEDWHGRYKRVEDVDHSYGEPCVFRGYQKLIKPNEFKFPGYEEENP